MGCVVEGHQQVKVLIPPSTLGVRKWEFTVAHLDHGYYFVPAIYWVIDSKL